MAAGCLWRAQSFGVNGGGTVMEVQNASAFFSCSAGFGFHSSISHNGSHLAAPKPMGRWGDSLDRSINSVTSPLSTRCFLEAIRKLQGPSSSPCNRGGILVNSHRLRSTHPSLSPFEPSKSATTVRAKAAAGATLSGGAKDNSPLDGQTSSAKDWQMPKPLPPPPKDISLFAVLPFLWKLAAGDPSLRWRLAAALCLLLGGKVSGLAGPLLFKRALDSLTEAKALTSAALFAAVGALVASATSKAISAVSNELRNVVFTPVGQATGRRVEYWFFSHILNMDMAFHLERKTGALSRIIERGKRSTTMIFRAVVFTFIPTFVELMLVCYLLAREFGPPFAVVVLFTFLAYIAWTVALTRASVARRKEMNRLDQLTSGKVVDTLLNYETVVQFNNQHLDLQSYDRLLLDYQKSAIDLEYVSAALNGGQSTIVAIGLAAVMAMAGLRIGNGSMTVGDLVLVNGLVLQLSLPLQFLGFLYRDLRQSLVDIEAVFEMFRMEPKLRDGTRELPWTAEGARVSGVDLEFAYTSAPSRKVLRGVSFGVEPGQSVAVVGPSGSGKSTIVKLLLRLYDPTQGGLSIDGCDLRELTQESLRRAVAVVPQDTVLFNDTIAYNIAYGRPSASQEEIELAAKQAKLHDAIMRMPGGYSTVVGERGLKLSGGEKQRVAIARAFLKAPRLLICDEATSALDSATEARILRSLQELATGRTCIFVAHRLSTIKHCDVILVMEAGQVLEQGTHEELLKAGGRYAQMWKLQESEKPPTSAQTEAGNGGTNELATALP